MRSSFMFALALALVAPRTFAQKPPAPSPRPPAAPASSSGPPSTELPPSNVQPVESQQDLVNFLGGRIVTNDATAVPSDMMIERVCNDKVRQQVYAAPNGDFTMQLGSRTDTVIDATAEPDSPVRLSRTDPTMGIPRRDLRNCELRASAPGFRASVVSLANVTGFDETIDRIDVGKVVVQRTSKIEGMTLSATPYRAPKDARKAYEKGLEAQKSGKLDDARKHYETAVQLYPTYESAWFRLGTVLQKQNDNDAARNAFTRATTINSKYMPAYLSLASMAFDAQNWTDVLKFTGHILEIDPLNHATVTGYVVDLDPWNFAEAYFFDAAANYSLGKFADAEKSALKAEHVDLRTQFPQLHLLLSKIYVLKKDYPNAISQLHTYLELVPSAKDADVLREQLAQLEKLNDLATTNKP
jgi:Tetratricopeptide repeat